MVSADVEKLPSRCPCGNTLNSAVRSDMSYTDAAPWLRTPSVVAKADQRPALQCHAHFGKFLGREALGRLRHGLVHHQLLFSLILPATARILAEAVKRIAVYEECPRFDRRRGVHRNARLTVVVLVRMEAALAATSRRIANERGRVEAGRDAADPLLDASGQHDPRQHGRVPLDHVAQINVVRMN